MSVFILLAAAVLSVLWILRDPLMRAIWRTRLRLQPFPAPWRKILRERVPYVRQLPADLQLQLKKHIQLFLVRKPFVGCQGLEVTEEMRVTIAAQACLLLLNRRTDGFANLSQVLVYPGAFIVDRERVDALGLAAQERRVLSGESWSQGQVILSWDDVLAGAAIPDDGRNVVLHEFAHQLDQATGTTNGAPHLTSLRRRQRWAEVMQREFAALQSRVDLGLPGLIDAYGSTSPAEFFAVVTEVFFECPQQLAAQHPELYAQLRSLYAIDPLSW